MKSMKSMIISSPLWHGYRCTAGHPTTRWFGFSCRGYRRRRPSHGGGIEEVGRAGAWAWSSATRIAAAGSLLLVFLVFMFANRLYTEKNYRQVYDRSLCILFLNIWSTTRQVELLSGWNHVGPSACLASVCWHLKNWHPNGYERLNLVEEIKGHSIGRNKMCTKTCNCIGET